MNARVRHITKCIIATSSVVRYACLPACSITRFGDVIIAPIARCNSLFPTNFMSGFFSRFARSLSSPLLSSLSPSLFLSLSHDSLSSLFFVFSLPFLSILACRYYALTLSLPLPCLSFFVLLTLLFFCRQTTATRPSSLYLSCLPSLALSPRLPCRPLSRPAAIQPRSLCSAPAPISSFFPFL